LNEQRPNEELRAEIIDATNKNESEFDAETVKNYL
jgi:hypothetical protein